MSIFPITSTPICTSVDALNIAAGSMAPNTISGASTQFMIERELARSKLYESILQGLYALKLMKKDRTPLNSSKVNYLLLRYVFNKLADRSQAGAQPENKDEKTSDVKSFMLNDDSVFMTHVSPLAINQLRDDFEYFGIKNHTFKDVSDMIEKRFSEAVIHLKTCKIIKDRPISLADNKILYGVSFYPDISFLGKKHPGYLKQALALQIRYKYLHLDTYGLSNPYADMGYKSDDKVVEGFGSAFNHYFNIYHSAFPDLESCFGSRGSFFDAVVPAGYLTICNPPFDVSVMKCMIAKVLDMLQTASENGGDQSFRLTLPDWTDMPELTSLKISKFCTEYKQIPQEYALFVESNTGKIVRPCNILQVLLKSRTLARPTTPAIIT